MLEHRSCSIKQKSHTPLGTIDHPTEYGKQNSLHTAIDARAQELLIKECL